MCSPPLSVGGGRRDVEPPTKFSKREYLIGPQVLEPQLLKVTKNLGESLQKNQYKGGDCFKGGDLDSLLI